MQKATIRVEKRCIPTYPQAAAEELPMFAENRVHQRSSGRPYPNKVVMQVDRSHKEDNGYFGTTPFFIPFVDDPRKLRRAQWLYLTGLCEAYQGNTEQARAQLSESVELNTDNMLAQFFNKYL